MAYKTLLSVLSDPALMETPLAQGDALAMAEDAHFDVLCLGVDRTQTGYYYAGANAMLLQESISRAQEDAAALEKAVKQRLEGTQARWATDTGVAQLADLGRIVAARARFSDLVILPRPYGEGCGAELEPIIESAMFEGHAPVLVMPDAAAMAARPKKIMISWNESVEAMNAIRAAMPFLQKADLVSVVVVDPPAHSPNRSDPGGPLSQWLSRHGVRVEIDVLSKTLPRVSDVILRHATDMDAELVVMGAYGHSRFREAILGGATRNMLEHASVPVFMAH